MDPSQPIPSANTLASFDTVPPLSMAIVNSSAGRLGADNLFRRYAGAATSHFLIHGNQKTDIKRTIFQIGRVSANKRQILRRPLEDNRAIPCVVASAQSISRSVADLVRRFPPTSPDWKTFDLCGLGAQLGRALTMYVQTGTITCPEIMGGRALRLRCIATYDEPVSHALGHIFIPRSINEICPGVFQVLVACASAYDVTVFTDILEVNAQNQPQLLFPVHADCAYAIVCAMRVLLSMYKENGTGGVMAYAITKGMHEAASVVAHSDEGGFIRDVIRRSDFHKPYGPVTGAFFDNYTWLPMPTRTSESTFVSLVDSILLMTAACSALSDPCTTINGKVYPTVFTDGTLNPAEPGENVAGGAPNSVVLSTDIATHCGEYVDIFINCIGRVFGVQNGGAAKACLRAQFDMMAGTDTRHLRYTSVAPYYWIEPTGLFNTFWDTTANAYGFGIFCPVDNVVVRSYFEKVTVTTSTSMSDTLAVSFRSMRTNPIIVALAHHEHNGLGQLIPRQYTADKSLLKGGVGTFAAARARSDDLASYMWAPNQTTIPHPANFIYLGDAIGMQSNHTAFDNINLNFNIVNLPTKQDLETDITSIASIPHRIDNFDLHIVDRTTQRSRSQAAIALANARNMFVGMGITGGENYAISDQEPHIWDVDEITAGGGAMERVMGLVQQAGTIMAHGPPMPHVIHSTPDRFRVQRNVLEGGGRGRPGRAPGEGLQPHDEQAADAPDLGGDAGPAII